MAELGSDDVLDYFDSLSNWGRWGENDELGTLNLITSDHRRRAATLVQTGRVFSCQRPMSARRSARNPDPLLHFMITSGEAAPAESWGGATDWFGVAVHGASFTHLDALGHMFWKGSLYNGKPSDRISTAAGVTFGGVDVAREGVVSRGVLLDIPHFRGIECLPPGEPIHPEELGACARAEDLEVRSGDVLLVRTGRDAPARGDRTTPEPAMAGLHARCLPWLHAHDVSVLASDGTNDVEPSGVDGLIAPVHIIGIVAMGLWVLDNVLLENLASACRDERRWEFLFVLAPLRLPRSTGSPVNPIAIM
jgi:kynurenine formamidase